LGQPFMVWVWVWKISPKTSNFSIFNQKNIFGSGQKVPGSKVGQPYLLPVKSKLGSGQARAHLYLGLSDNIYF